MNIDIPEQILDAIGNALVIAARNSDQTGVFVQTWAWLNAATQNEVARLANVAAENQKKDFDSRVEAEVAKRIKKV